MKRFLSLLLLILLVAFLTACSQQARSIETSNPAQTEAHNTSTEAPTPSPSPTPEPKPFVPMDIFASECNLFGDMEMPDIFTVFEATFNKGSAKLEGKCQFVLSMTGSGSIFAAVAYHADVAGLSEDEKNNRINAYLDGGFCQFEGKDGHIVIIRQVDSNDDRYAYVEADGNHRRTGGGCVIEITSYVDAADVEKYTDLVRDNYNLNALTPIADYLDVETDFSECGITVNLHKNEARAYVVYYLPNVDAVQKGIEENVQGGWWDWNGMMQTVMQYGPIESKLTCDSKAGAITIEQKNTDLNAVTGEYVEAEVSLTKFGFGFDEVGVCGVYEQHEPRYMSVAIHRPEWGEFDGGWNIEYYDEVNGYVVRITYNADEGKYHISADRGSVGAAFDYLPAIKEYTGEYPDRDTVKRMFNDAFGTQGEDFYEKPMAYFEQLVQERFGMSIDELYALPIY